MPSTKGYTLLMSSTSLMKNVTICNILLYLNIIALRWKQKKQNKKKNLSWTWTWYFGNNFIFVMKINKMCVATAESVRALGVRGASRWHNNKEVISYGGNSMKSHKSKSYIYCAWKSHTFEVVWLQEDLKSRKCKSHWVGVGTWRWHNIEEVIKLWRRYKEISHHPEITFYCTWKWYSEISCFENHIPSVLHVLKL